MKNILYITGDLCIAGGIGRMITLKANWLANKGYNVTILRMGACEGSIYYDIDPKVTVDAFKIDMLGIYKNKRNLFGFIKSGYQRFLARKKEKQFLMDYIYSHKFDVVFTTDVIPSIPFFKDGSKKIYEAHFSSQGKIEFLKTLTPLKRYLYSLYDGIQSRALKKYDRIVILTQKDMGMQEWPTNTIVIPNFITIKAPDHLTNFNNKSVISVGRLDYPKGYEFLLEAWGLVKKEHPDWTLHIYGHAYDRKEYFQNIISENNIEDVAFIHDPVSNIQDKYLESDFYVMSSRYEGFPLVLGEAMICGLPCISYNCNCGPDEIIKDGLDGIIVPEVGDIIGLAKSINWLIEHPGAMQRYGKAASVNIKRYEMDKIMPLWVNLIENEL